MVSGQVCEVVKKISLNTFACNFYDAETFGLYSTSYVFCALTYTLYNIFRIRSVYVPGSVVFGTEDWCVPSSA